MLRGGLGVGLADEQAVRPHPARHPLETGLDRAIQVPDRLELLQVRHDLVGLVVRQRDGLGDRLEALLVLDVQPLRPLEEGEVAERGLAEGQQRHLDARRVAVGGHREVRAGPAVGAAPDRRQQVLDERQVEHLLLPDAEQLFRQRWTATSTSSEIPSLTLSLSEKAANRYWRITRCSSSAALPSV